jgi:hypothetical protein
MSTPIFVAANFATVQPRRPFIGYPGNPIQVFPNINDPVDLQLSDNQVIRVFDTKDTALRCLEYMRTAHQWLLTPTDDIMIIAVSYTKLLIAESSLINQKLFASFLPIYYGGVLRFIHRSMSLSMDLADALTDVGFFVADPLTNQYQLANATRKPHITVVDINYKANVTADDPGSLLSDLQRAIQYNFVDNPAEAVV